MVKESGKMNNKGQALIEFVLIIPIFILMVLATIEFGNVIYQKYELENHLDYIIDLYEKDETTEITQYVEKNNIQIKYEKDTKYINITLTKNIKISAPVVSNILGSSYEIKTDRKILHEES